MGFSNRFAWALLGWVGLMLLAGWALLWSLGAPDLGAARIVAALLLAGTIAGLLAHVRRTNAQVSRFVEAIRFGDLSQSFSQEAQGSGFDEVGQAINEAIRKLRDERHELSESSRFCEAILDDSPTALLIVDGDGRVDLANKAARRLLMRHSGVRIEDFAAYGSAFLGSLGESSVGRPRLVPLVVDGVAQTVMISAAVVHRLGGLVRVVAVQPIQSELNAVEIAAQSDLIRVLTHEIMNSMTPVTSLAHTAAALVAKAKEPADLADVREAVETLARRADGVMHFVETYRQISRAPRAEIRSFAVKPWAEEVAVLFRASGVADGIDFTLDVDPQGLLIDADPDLLFQVLINLLKNGAEAAAGHSEAPAVRLSFRRGASGGVVIEVADNGPGIADGIRQDVFLPFFTTKKQGTGVGLSLARQIVLAHGGSILADDAPGGGTLFRLVI